MTKNPVLLILMAAWTPTLLYATQDNDNRPSEHYCPITLQVMDDPVVADDGQTYERSALLQYLNTTDITPDKIPDESDDEKAGKAPLDTNYPHHPRPKVSPFTRQPLGHQFVPNVALRKMIQDWQPSASPKAVPLDQRTPEAIAQRVSEEFAKNEALLTQEQTSKGKDIVAFLGNTGAGKSTLINLLAGKALIVSDDGEDFVLADPHDAQSMAIGTGGQSETLYPKAIDVGDLRFFDLPGFNDTDGSERNLINAAFIRKILLEAASVRLVFVAGQDQFTADRSTSVRQMFQAIQQLFVLADQTDQMIQNGVFVATKTTCNDTVDIIQFLLKKTDARDKEALNQQLLAWYQNNKLYRMYHPDRDDTGDKNKNMKDQLLLAIQNMPGIRVKGVNVSALYPSETQNALEKMFYAVLRDFFQEQLNTQLTTLSEYEDAIDHYSRGTYWDNLEDACCEKNGAMKLLKEFCAHPYTKARQQLAHHQEQQRQNHIQGLKKGRAQRITDVQNRTTTRTQQVIASIPQSTNGMITFDFGYHKDFYDQVCGQGLYLLATDDKEQQVVRDTYANIMGQHGHGQFSRWLQQYGGQATNADVAKQFQQRISLLEQHASTLPDIAVQLDHVERRLIEKQEDKARKTQQQSQDEAWQAMAKAYQTRHSTILKEISNVPAVARNHMDVYWRFMNAKLIYTHPETKQKTEWVFGSIMPQLFQGGRTSVPFDLSGCDANTQNNVSVNIGFRVNKNPANKNKTEVWLILWFWLAAHINGSAAHYKPVFDKWEPTYPAGIFWTGGWWDDKDGDCRYLVNQDYDKLSDNNLYEKARRANGSPSWRDVPSGRAGKEFQILYVK